MSEGKIYAALASVMQTVGAVGKARKNIQQGYQFRGIDDVMAHVQAPLAAAGVVVVPRVLEREREMIPTKNGGTMASVRLLVAHDFFAADGSSVTCTTLGEAMDSGDKASNKAMSAALKYALTQTLCLPTYEVDRDTEEHSPQMVTPAQPKPPPSPPRIEAGDELAAEVERLVRTIKEATTTGELLALTPRLRALPEAERAKLRTPFDARIKALAGGK